VLKEYIQVFTTTGRREDAEKIAQTLAQKRLAGCVQIIGPISSTFWWKSRIETAEEWLCLIKSEKGLFKELEKTIKETHPYHTPEITAVPIVAGSKEYLRWLDQELKKSYICLSYMNASSHLNRLTHYQSETGNLQG
jgi:periplasmic divalent cation tolerance protein